ncbi:MAG: sulfotransferase family 2 domain-containing protein [Alphaproteobacteria bacterium]
MRARDYVKDHTPRFYERLSALAHRGYYSRGTAMLNAVFIHIPKTGGTSIRSLVPGSGKGHATALEYRRANPRKFERVFKFSFVRNPWDRVASAYWFLEQGGDPDVNDTDKHCEADERAFAFGSTTSLNQFVEERLHLCMNQPHFQPQHGFICDAGMNLMDFTGQYEALDADFEIVRRRLGIKGALPRLNRSRQAVKTDWSRQAHETIGTLYETDISIFGY